MDPFYEHWHPPGGLLIYKTWNILSSRNTAYIMNVSSPVFPLLFLRTTLKLFAFCIYLFHFFLNLSGENIKSNIQVFSYFLTAIRFISWGYCILLGKKVRWMTEWGERGMNTGILTDVSNAITKAWNVKEGQKKVAGAMSIKHLRLWEIWCFKWASGK